MIVFESRSGYWGQYGWKVISFFKWMILFPNHITIVRLKKKDVKIE